MIVAIKTELESLLNSSAFTTDSIEGWLVILLLLFMGWNISRKALKFVAWSVSFIFLVQVFYWLSFTGLNDIIPLSEVFKYDVLTSIAQCFVGSRLCDGILWVNAFIQTICTQAYNLIADLFGNFGSYFDSIKASAMFWLRT